MSPKRDAVVPSESEIIEVLLLFRNPKGIGQLTLSTKLEFVVNWIVFCRKSFAISELIGMVDDIFLSVYFSWKRAFATQKLAKEGASDRKRERERGRETREGSL